MNAGQETADPFQGSGVAQLRRPSAAAREHGKAVAGEVVQRAPVDAGGRHDRNLLLRQLFHEGVFLEDGGLAPAPWPVELDDHRRSLFQADLVDAVLVAVERQQAAVAVQADALDGLQHRVRVEPCVRMGLLVRFSRQILHPRIVRATQVFYALGLHWVLIVRPELV